MSDYLKVPEVSRRLNISEKTTRRYIKSGELPCVFIGGSYRISEEDLAEYLRAAVVKPGGVDAHPKAAAGPLSFSRWLAERFGHSYLALSEEELIRRFDDLEAVEDAANKKRDLLTAVQAEYLATIKTRHLPPEERVLVRGHHREAGGKWLLAQTLSGQAEGITEAFEQSIKEAIEAAMGETA